MISTLGNIINATTIVYCELNLLTNIEVTLDQRCNFHVVASMMMQRLLRAYTTLSLRCVFAGEQPLKSILKKF